MLRRAAETGADAGKHHERNFHLPAEHIAHLGGIVQHLVHTNADEIHEHQFGDSPHSGGRRADGGADECRFGKGRIQHPLVAELLNQPDGSAERPAPSVNNAQMLAPGAPGDFLPHNDDRFVALHFLPDSLVDGLPYLQLPGGGGGCHSSLLTSSDHPKLP